MRIAYIGDMTSVHLRRWTQVFAEKGNDVTVMTTGRFDEAAPPGVRVIELLAPRSHVPVLASLHVAVNVPRMVARVRTLLSDLAPDVVHVHYFNEAALWAVLASPVPVIVTAWGSDIVVAPQRSRLRRWAVQYVLRRADMVTCDAEHMRRRIEDLGAAPEKVKVIFFGTDVERYHPQRRNDATRRAFGAETTPLVISIRSLEPVYDIPTLLAAVPRVLQSCPSAKFIIAGRGSLAESLKQQATSLGVGDRVQFVGGVSQDDLPALLASCDVYVSTALSDGGLAASTAEAMAAGASVAISNVSDNADWVEHGVTGALFPAKDAPALAAAVIDLISNPEKRARIGAAGRRVIVERCNKHLEMERMQQLYESVRISRHGGRA